MDPKNPGSPSNKSSGTSATGSAKLLTETHQTSIPSSQKSRRSRGQIGSDEHNPFTGSIDLNSKVRQGFSPLPRASDSSEHPPEVKLKYQGFADLFRSILDAANIDWRSFDIFQQHFEGHSETSSKAYIRVDAPWRSNDDGWYVALSEFEDRIFTKGKASPDELGIELRDSKQEEWMSELPEDHDIFELWGRFKTRAVEVLQDLPWCIMTPCRYGPNPESKLDPIVIFIGVENPHLFGEVGWAIIKLCREMGLDDVSVRIVETRINNTTSATTSATTSDLTSVEDLDVVGMGSSICPGDFEYSGTLGGVVKVVSASGKKETFGLTNFHVIQDIIPKGKVFIFQSHF